MDPNNHITTPSPINEAIPVTLPPAKKKHLFLILGISMGVIALAALGYFLYTRFVAQKPVTPTAMSAAVVPTSFPEEKIYYLNGSQEQYNLYDLSTGQSTPFPIQGFSLLTGNSQTLFPDYLILQKENTLYSYSVKSKSVNKISPGNEDLTLKEDEEANFMPSITEKDKFYILIYRFQKSEETDGMGWPAALSQRQYFYDASTNKLEEAIVPNFDGCFLYDSKNSRFITWVCGEPIISALPISLVDLQWQKIGNVATPADFGVKTAEELNHVFYYSDKKIIMKVVDKPSKLIVIDLALPIPTKEEFVVTDQLKPDFDKTHIYSIALSKEHHTFIIGGGQLIKLLRFNDSKEVFDSVTFDDKNVYVNGLYVYKNTAYYQSKDTFKSINLSTWEYGSSFASPEGREVTLIRVISSY